MKKVMTREEREKLIKEAQCKNDIVIEKGLSGLSDTEFKKFMADLEDENRFEGVENGEVIRGVKAIKAIQKASGIKKKKKIGTCKFVRKNGTLTMIKTKDHFNISKDMKIKARKKQSKRLAEIKKAVKEEQRILKEQKKNLAITRRQTPEILFKIGERVSKIEEETLGSMAIESLKHILELQKTSNVNFGDLLIKVHQSIDKCEKEIQNKITKKLGKILSKEEANYMMNRAMESCLMERAETYRRLIHLYQPELKDAHKLPRIAPHNIANVNAKIKKNHLQSDRGVDVIEGNVEDLDNYNPDILNL